MFQEIYICRRGNLFFLEEPRAKFFFYCVVPGFKVGACFITKIV